MTTIVYRESGPSDISAMARLRAAEWETEEYWRTRITRYLSGELDPQKALKPRVSYVAVEGEALVGLIAGHLTRRHQCQGELEWINVAAGRRGGGIAAELLNRLAAWFLEQGALRVCVDVVPGNLTARRFYTRHGARVLNPHWLVWEDVGTILRRP